MHIPFAHLLVLVVSILKIACYPASLKNGTDYATALNGAQQARPDSKISQRDGG
jgi:hypothetical protein